MFGEICDLEMIRMYLKDEEIYDHYFDFSYTNKFSSPYRFDPSPSLSFKQLEDGTVMWKDFGDPDQKHFDPPGLVMKIYDETYFESCMRIWRDLVIYRKSEFKELDVSKFAKGKYVSESKYSFEFFDDSEFIGKYMEDLGIDTNVMKLAGVRPVQTVYFEGEIKWEWSDDDPIYHYKIDEDGWKLYRPLDDSYKNRDKFRAENIYGKLECLNLANGESKVLIITKSTKDCLLLKTIGYDCVAPTSESSTVGVKNNIADWYEQYDYIFVLFDNDSGGIKGAKKLLRLFSKMIDASFVLSTKNKDEKDCADYVNKYSIERLKQLVDAYVKHLTSKIDIQKMEDED